MKKYILWTGIILVLCIGLLAGCKAQEDDAVVLNIANCEEYIDEGGWDESETIALEDGTKIIGINSMISDFETWYEKKYGKKVKVKYSTYGNNEELYNQMSLGNVYDLVCPSDYMIMKLMGEDRLQPFSDHFLDASDRDNYYVRGVSAYFKDQFNNLKVKGDQLSNYAAGYMWGNCGIVYNPDKVDRADVTTWEILRNSKYRKRVTLKDSVRDSYFVSLGILNRRQLLSNDLSVSQRTEILNDASAKTIDKAEAILSDIRENAYSLENESGKADMVTGKVYANMQWSGDAVYAMNQAEEDGIRLRYAVPEECSNLWFDGWCMMKDGVNGSKEKQQAAEAFINFISRSDNVIRNMYYIGYTSAISGDDDLIYQYVKYCYESTDENAQAYPLGYFFENGSEKDNKKYTIMADKEQFDRQLSAQYPPEEIIQRCTIMKNFDSKENERISQMWINIRCFDPGFEIIK